MNILDEWLLGTTCHRLSKRTILFENEEYIVLKHGAHASYCDRVVGSGNCASYAGLFRKSGIKLKGFAGSWWYGGVPEHIWEGRISLKKVRQDCLDLFGIQFEAPDDIKK